MHEIILSIIRVPELYPNYIWTKLFYISGHVNDMEIT